MLLAVVCGSLLAYILLCLRRHIRANTGGLPFALYVSGRAGMGMFSRLHLLGTFVGVVIVVLFSFSWRSVGRHVTYLHSCLGDRCGCCCLCMFGFCFFVFVCVVPSLGCVWLPPCVPFFILSPFLSLHTILLFRGGGGLVLLAAACMCGHTFRSLCLRRAGVGMITQSQVLVFLVGAGMVMLYLAA